MSPNHPVCFGPPAKDSRARALSLEGEGWERVIRRRWQGGRLRPKRPLRDARGVTAVEFGLLVGPLMVLLMGLADLGMRAYVGVQLQGTLDQAARKVTIGSVTTATLTTFVQSRISPLLRNATVVVTAKSYDDFSDVGKPEPITTDTAPIGSYNTGDCFLDLNGNNRWDSDSAVAGNGGGDDVVYYTATVSYPLLLPLGRLLGLPATESVSATTMLRNQPYAAQAQPVTVCT